MNTQRLKWLVPAVVVGVGVIWWGASAYASSQAEKRLRQTLAEHGVQDRVQWGSLSVSLFGTVTLKDVVISPPGQDVLQARVVRISDVIDKPDRQRIRLHAEGLEHQDPAKPSFLLGETLGAPTGRPRLPAMEATLAVDARYGDDEGELALTMRQPEAMDIDYRMTVTQIGPLRELARAAGGKGQQAMSGLGMLGSLSSLSRVSLKALDARVEDRGAVARGIALYKRHNVPLQVDGGSVRSQRNKAFEQDLEAWRADCQRAGPALLTVDPAKSCQAGARFVSSDGRSLRVKASPRTPVPFEQLMGVMFGRPSPALAGALNAEVSS